LKTWGCYGRPPAQPGRCSGWMIQKLSTDFLSTSGPPIFINISATESPTALEAPVMFKAHGWYYATGGTLSCAQFGGTTVFAFKSRHPMGEYALASRSEPNGCIAQKTDSRAQGTATFSVGGDLIWLGNQWLTSKAPNKERNYDLLRFAKLNISATDGLIESMRWQQNISVVVS
jgi:beta-xylosidase